MKQKVILVQPTKHLSETDMASMALGVAQVSELATFQDHIGVCKKCQSELEVLQDLAGLVRSLPSEQSQPMGTKATFVDDETAWETALTALRQYVLEHGHTRVPDDYCTTDGHQLGRWVAQQRERFLMFGQVEKEARIPQTWGAKTSEERRAEIQRKVEIAKQRRAQTSKQRHAEMIPLDDERSGVLKTRLSEWAHQSWLHLARRTRTPQERDSLPPEIQKFYRDAERLRKSRIED